MAQLHCHHSRAAQILGINNKQIAIFRHVSVRVGFGVIESIDGDPPVDCHCIPCTEGTAIVRNIGVYDGSENQALPGSSGLKRHSLSPSTFEKLMLARVFLLKERGKKLKLKE